MPKIIQAVDPMAAVIRAQMETVKEKKKTSSVKICPNCSKVIRGSKKKCPSCDFVLF